jgi:hypothetical protein
VKNFFGIVQHVVPVVNLQHVQHIWFAGQFQYISVFNIAFAASTWMPGAVAKQLSGVNVKSTTRIPSPQFFFIMWWYLWGQLFSHFFLLILHNKCFSTPV